MEGTLCKASMTLNLEKDVHSVSKPGNDIHVVVILELFRELMVDFSAEHGRNGSYCIQLQRHPGCMAAKLAL